MLSIIAFEQEIEEGEHELAEARGQLYKDPWDAILFLPLCTRGRLLAEPELHRLNL